jgi:hypothetical protein
MSADNFILVRKHPDGGYVNVMGFASDPTDTDLGYEGERTATLGDAAMLAARTYCEYGYSIEDATEGNRP